MRFSRSIDLPLATVNGMFRRHFGEALGQPRVAGYIE
jgi:hypothetical protein